MAESHMNTVKLIPECELKRIGKILIIQYKPFGDVLLNTGYLPTLRKKFPHAKIDYLIQRPYAVILEDNPYIDELVFMKKLEKRGLHRIPYLLERCRVIALVRSRKYDLIIDQLRGPGSAQITMFSGARYRLGWVQKRWKWVYNYKVKRDNFRYYSRAKFDMLQPLGIREVEHNTFMKIKDESKNFISDWLRQQNLDTAKIVLFSPGSPVKEKQWSLKNYAHLGDLILKYTSFKLVLLWGPGEKNDIEFIYNHMNNKPVIAPPTTFNQAGALLQASTIFIGNDGGINHLAVAMDTPTLTIFGPKTDPRKWTAWHKDIHNYLRDWDFKDPKDNTFNISPEQVFEKFKEYIDL